MGKIKVLLVDDKEVFRAGLAKLLEEQENIEVVYQCDNIAQAIKKITQVEPDVALINAVTSESDSMEAARKISALPSKIKVAVITGSNDKEELFSAIRAGATGYLVKDITVDDLVKSIELVAKGEAVVSPPMAQKLANRLNEPKASEAEVKDGLSDREQEILKLLAKGHTNKEIGDTLFITENTAKVHVKHILGKLQLRNRQQASVYAVQQGLVTEVKDVEENPR